jgi:propanediol dehydratase large subunit
MTPPDDSTDKPSATPAHKFPPGLDFLDSIQRAQQTEDREMRRAILGTFLTNVRDHADLLRKHGYNPERFLSMEEWLRNSAAADKKVEELQEQLLQSVADAADATWRAVDALEEAIKVAAEQRPFDAQVEEWKELLEELREQYPKID